MKMKFDSLRSWADYDMLSIPACTTSKMSTIERSINTVLCDGKKFQVDCDDLSFQTLSVSL